MPELPPDALPGPPDPVPTPPDPVPTPPDALPAPESQALARLDLPADVPPALRQAVGAALEWVDRLGRDAAGLGGPASPPRDRVRRLR